MTYSILAYYIFTPIEDPEKEVAKHKEFFQGRDVACRIYIAKEGINGQMCAATIDAEMYMKWLRSDPRFCNVEFKIHAANEQVFPRITVKVRKQLVALDATVDMSMSGKHLSPKEWKEMLESRGDDTLLLDVRNDYEWEIGRFEGAALPDLKQFREFPTYAKALKESRDPKTTKVMMYCTGGIRCELYSALLRQEGFDQVFQLQGGVIKYGLEEGSQHWRGKLFVFDDRLAVTISDAPADVISACCHCGMECDLYYNCANMDCNELFVCCAQCAEKLLGCCCEECKAAPRIRAFEKKERPKPFRRILKDGRAKPKECAPASLEEPS